ncbi:hypothetical protein EVAR_74558_1 [Eumeta japonica]|uniref:Uncharacterized protein n=1 Tax=Eumeta variegata TaxID=151549 RepID=A0A4C1TCS0_EUMVA|nr:hypothetical protein EVAR_74558_1 [Eumeta japonica]
MNLRERREKGSFCSQLEIANVCSANSRPEPARTGRGGAPAVPTGVGCLKLLAGGRGRGHGAPLSRISASARDSSSGGARGVAVALSRALYCVTYAAAHCDTDKWMRAGN